MNNHLTTIERIHLHYYNPSINSDKVYNIELMHNPITNKYSVFFEYGRRGRGLRPGFKVENTDEANARVAMNKLSYSKQYNSRSQYDLIAHDTNMQAINPAPYIKLANDLHAGGTICSHDKEKIVNLLLSKDSGTVTLAINVLSARNNTLDIPNAA
jgi:hypothetical protein